MSLDVTEAEVLLASPGAAATDALPRATLWIMAAACGAAVSNPYYNQPLLDDFAHYFHATPARAALVSTAAQVGYGVGMFFLVPLGDLVERRKLILALVWACVVVSVGMALAPTLAVLIELQLLLGAAACMSQVLIPLGIDLTPPSQRGRTVGTLMAGLLCGILLARTAAGFLAQLRDWRTVYEFGAGLMFVTGFVLMARLPHRPPTLSMPYGRLLASMLHLLRTQPRLWTASLVSGLSFAGFTAFWATLSFLMKSHFHMGAAETGLFGIVGLAGAMGSPLAGRLSDRHGPIFTVLWSLVISAVAFIIMWKWITIAGLIIGVLLMDLGVQSIQVAEQSAVMSLVAEARSRINTLYMVARFTGGAGGSALGALAWVRFGWGGVCGMSLGLIALALVVNAVEWRQG